MSRLMEVRKTHYLLAIVLVKWAAGRFIFLGIVQVVRFEVWEVLVVVLNVGGMLIMSGSGEVWIEPPLFHPLFFIQLWKKKRFCCWIIAMHKGRNFSRGEGEEEGMGMKFGWVCGAKTLQFWPCLKAKYIQIATLFKMLNSEIEYFILRLTPKGTIFHIWRQETMYLLMTTYRQDIITNFRCVCDGSTVYPFFRAVYQNMHKHTLYMSLSTV